MPSLASIAKRIPAMYVVFAVVFLTIVGTVGYLLVQDRSLFQSEGSTEGQGASLSLRANTNGERLQQAEFPINQDVGVDVVLNTHDVMVDGVEAIVEYDPTVLSAQVINFGTSEIPQLNETLTQQIERDASGDEVGRVHFAVTAIPLPPYTDSNQIPAYTPIPSGTEATVATIRFRTLKFTNSSTVAVKYLRDNRNDSNVSLYRNPGKDGLSEVNNLVFSITPIGEVATLHLEPAQATVPVGNVFEVLVKASTGGQTIDSIDAVIFYDKSELAVMEVRETGAFQEYPRKKIDLIEGKVDISGIIKASTGTSGINGTDIHVATLVVEALAPSRDAQLRVEYLGYGDPNDSNVTLYGEGVDILGEVSHASYVIQGSGTPTSSSEAIELDILYVLEGQKESSSAQTKSFEVTVSGNDVRTAKADATQGTNSVTVVFDDLTAGDYDVTVKPEGFLPKTVSTTLSKGSNVLNLTPTIFLAGDLDGSGQVNALDFNTLSSKFGTTDRVADLDGSNQVNSLDYSLLLKNWNNAGK